MIYRIEKTPAVKLKSFKTFESEDEKDLLQDLDKIGIEQHKGWIVCTQSSYDGDMGTSIWAVVAKNAGEAAVLIMENMGMEDEEDDLEIARGSKDFSGLAEAMENQMGYNGKFSVVEYFEGLVPKKYEDYSLEIDWTNPVMAVKDLESLFTNVSQVLNKSYV